MDFKRIQAILLAVFLVFDLFLIIEITDRIDSQTNPQLPPNVVNIESILQDRNVKLDTDLPDEQHHLPMVKVSPQTFDLDRISNLAIAEAEIEDRTLKATLFEPLALPVTFSEEMEYLTQEEAELIYNEVIVDRALIEAGEDYPAYTYRPTQRMIIYRMQVPEGYPIVDGTAEIRLQLNEDYELVEYTQTVQGDFIVLDNVKPLITAREAVTKLDQRMESVIPDHSILQEVSLSYYRSLDLEELAIYSPAWEIVYLRPDGSVSTSIVDAMRGQIISRSQLSQN